MKNTVAVPRHWNQKCKYFFYSAKFLQTKRGILKPMFKLPEYIEATGISKLRDPYSERDGQKMVR
jgi:splicing factor 3B subunit 2